MKNIKIVFLVLIFICELNSFATVSTTWISSEEIKNIKLGRQPSRQGIKRRELEDKYPWLVSRDELNKEFLRIAECFSDCPKDKDVWCEFKPLLKSFMDAHGLAGTSHFEMELSAVSVFCHYSFAGEDEVELIKADFSGRRDCLSYICKFMYVFCPSEIENLGAWLASAKFLKEDVETKKREFLKAEELDRDAIYRITKWNKKYIDEHYSRFKNLRPEWKKTEEKFKFRKIYNKNLAEFRAFAFAEIRKSILTGYGDGSNVTREKIWEEFCQKAKATVGEKIAAEKAVPRIKEEKKIGDKNKDVEISVEF